MDGLLEKFVPGGYRGVQLMAYSWELADRILSVGDGRVVVGKSEGEVVTDHRSVIPLITPNN
jgi:hypothetical protein